MAKKNIHFERLKLGLFFTIIMFIFNMILMAFLPAATLGTFIAGGTSALIGLGLLTLILTIYVSGWVIGILTKKDKLKVQ